MDAALSPEPIMQVASGFMAAKHLFAANELGLFEALADGPATLDGLAARCGLTPRTARISADAMVALGLLERDADTYRNTPVAAAFLAGTTPADLRPFLRFWDKVSYPAWERLTETLAKGQPERELTDRDEATQRIASAGIEAILTGPAMALAEGPELADRTRLLDVGGGTGSWSILAVRSRPGLRATVLELPTVAAFARERIAEAGLTDRIAVAVGDALTEPLPEDHDACLVANVVHYFSPEENRRLVQRLRNAVAEGARLLIADFWTDPTHTEPAIAALMAGEFAVHIHHGDVYSLDEGRSWIEAAGWRFVGHRPLAGPVSVLTAEAV